VLSAHTVSAVNPVGAGDCLVAGLAEGYATGRRLVESARRGMAMAAAGCETLAAGAFERDRFEQLLRSGVGPVGEDWD
jgi:fructose-1-phosphate kinase PfkB-like protein